MPYFTHETAVIDENVSIGDNTKIWHFCHVSDGANIGSNVVLGQNVFVGGKAEIGNGCKIQNNVSVYDNVFLETDVFCGPSVVFTNVINPRSKINRKADYKDTRVKEGASLGANCTIICGVTVGRFAFVGAGSVVNKDVPDFALVVGVPAVQIGWMSEFGERLSLPLEGESEVVCPHSGDIYKLKGHVVLKEEVK